MPARLWAMLLPYAVIRLVRFICKVLAKNNEFTGTLTTNRMTVVQSYINGEHHKHVPKWDSLDKETRAIMVQVISLNSSYSSHVSFCHMF